MVDRNNKNKKEALQSAFAEAYKKLNSEQMLAVDSIEGPVFVIAGPGTGKTQVLALRIANILRTTDTAPESILALTFTESGAGEMRQRLERIIGTTAYKIRIHTFHGFAEQIITHYPDYFPRIIGAFVATDIERAEILEQAIRTSDLKFLRPYGDPQYYHRAVSGAIQTLKRENVTPESLLVRVQESEKEFENTEGKIHEKGKYLGKMKGEYLTLEKKIAKTRELHTLYVAYEAGLTALRRYDYEDLILEVEKALTTDDTLRLQVQESLLYILADEHQDANRAQNALLELLSGFFDRPNLFIVGDEKQAIYRFQGAELDNVHYFRARFPDTRIISLIENYRSTQHILDAALSLITASPDERLSRVPLIANTTRKSKPISLIACETPLQEMATLAEHIRLQLANGTNPSEIAVLVRRNQDVTFVSESLINNGIGVTGSVTSSALHNRFVLALLRLLKFIAAPKDEHSASIFTLPAFTMDSGDVWRVLHESRTSKTGVLSILASDELLAKAQVIKLDAAKKLGATLAELLRLAAYERPAEVAEKALRNSGLLSVILTAPDRAESLAAVRSVLTVVGELSRRSHDALLPQALNLLERYEERGIALSARGAFDETRVRVMTVHGAKGREFEQIFIPLLSESSWSTRSRAEHFYVPDILSGAAELEDERRLLYVAITRAKAHATLSYAKTRDDGRIDSPSVLVDDLDAALVERFDSTVTAEDPLTFTRSLRTTGQPTQDDLATLRAAFYKQGLSPTAFNNYRSCPWKYFYVNLLRIPQSENKHMLYGTAIHKALSVYADARAVDKDIGVLGLIGAFEQSISRAALSTQEIDDLLEKGKRALPMWWEVQHSVWPTQSKAELAIVAFLPYGAAPEGNLTIRGALDRVDEMPGGVRVIDYKTGKPRSRNELLGETKNANGDYYRQLTFYKLLLLRTEQSQTMIEGRIDFVEPDDAGKMRSENFIIEDEEVLALESSIIKTADEITSLSFWNDSCNEKDCEWCPLRFGV
jgi:DNA helicase-2/ATP-dependent DNA helicase PcrA